ncbi:protein KINESIN LIGHT CHAIN-RELATED 1-like [Zingiber officinale]|uniref:Uncharacterized protein n=1 Tax=Zingiber officinale TaxID=94328 RepID=A0A8J5FUN4_ZINOF|nr:protein KINESIN LIGHT CHAIN-RELATED 1-like [Zingiber officinale]KAG6496280.1 hypothetical protein ZIOFF_044139 [Zingiber officinale]
MPFGFDASLARLAMKRALSASLLSLSSLPKTRLSGAPLTSFLSRFSALAPSPISPSPSCCPLLSPFFPPHFPSCPLRRGIRTVSVGPTPPKSLNTVSEVLAAFESLESSLDDDTLRLSEQLDLLGSEDLEKALAFSVKALQFFEKRDGGWSLPVAKVLCLMGSITCKMRRYDDSLDSLETADQILEVPRGEISAQKDVVMTTVAVQLQLANTKTAMGRRWAALTHLQNSFELKGTILEGNSKQMGSACKDLAEALAVVLVFDEALPLGLRALEIYMRHFGESSEEVVQVRRLLGVIYSGLEEYEEALEQSELSRRALECLGLDEQLCEVEIDGANILIELGRLELATQTLKRVAQKTEKESETRAFVLISMAKCLCNQEKFGDAKRCLEIACGILDKKEAESPSKVAGAYVEMSMLYETMDVYEIALSLMKRTLAILQDLPQERHLEGSVSARVGWLLLYTKRVPLSIPYLESAIVKIKDCFGPKHFGLGLATKHLGQAYLDTNQPQSAVEMFLRAKDIIDESFGLQHEDSIDTYQCIANAYGTMGSYERAMEFQQHVIDAWENNGSGSWLDIRESHRLMEQLKKKVRGERHAVFPANSLPTFLLENKSAQDDSSYKAPDCPI